MEKRIIGSCSLCGGQVKQKLFSSDAPRCESCGATAAMPATPVIPMQPMPSEPQLCETAKPHGTATYRLGDF